MNSQQLRLPAILGTGVLVIALAATAVFGFFSVPNVQAQTPVPQPPTTISGGPVGSITVVGEGTVNIRPDITRANIGVEVVRNSVQEASAENKVAIEAVLEALRAQGIEERDIQTSGFSIYAERYGPEGPLPDDQVRYRVSNNVMVTIRNLDNVGTVLDAAVEAGANNIYGVEFAIDDPSGVEAEARASAIEDAQVKAQDLAQLNGVGLGQVVAVSEIIGMGGGYYNSNFAQGSMFQMGGGGAAPISPGELKLTMQVQVSYAIAQ
jgi:uncharacterized protein YggE